MERKCLGLSKMLRQRRSSLHLDHGYTARLDEISMTQCKGIVIEHEAGLSRMFQKKIAGICLGSMGRRWRSLDRNAALGSNEDKGRCG